MGRRAVTRKAEGNAEICQAESYNRRMTGELAMPSVSRRRAIRGFAMLLAGAAAARAASSRAAETAPLAIKGYDPVAYFTLGKATPGLPEIEYEWDERRYRFASAADRDLFKADPVRYAPQFADFCAMSLANGARVEANPQNWLISDGKLYLFGKPAPAGAALFQQDLAGNIARADRNRALIRSR
jgi:hypothetical protein